MVRVQPLSHSPTWSQYRPNQSGNTTCIIIIVRPSPRRLADVTHQAPGRLGRRHAGSRWRLTAHCCTQEQQRRGEVRQKKKPPTLARRRRRRLSAVNAPAATSRFLSLVSGAAQGRANSAKKLLCVRGVFKFPKAPQCWPAITLAAGGPQRCKTGTRSVNCSSTTGKCQLTDEPASVLDLIHPPSVLALPRGFSLLLRRSVHAMPRQEH